MGLTLDTQKLASLRGAIAHAKPRELSKKYCIQTFGCQMNYADSEKIHMLLTQAGLSKVDTWEEADIVLFNTCSVRQKSEDKVFGYVEEIDRLRLKTGRDIKVGLTGCMTRKTGLNRKYYDYQGRKNTTKIELLNLEKTENTQQETREIENKTNSTKTSFLKGDVTQGQGDLGEINPQSSTSSDSSFKKGAYQENSVFNSDDELFGRTDNIDFVVRIEEIGSLTTLFSIMYGEDIGQDDTFQSYLRVKQDRDNSGSANVIIQTGCDNYCTFCIVPYTRGHEVSRPIDDIVSEVADAVAHGAKEVTLLGQNVNSFGKETKKSLWNAEELKWHPGVGNLSPSPLLKGEGALNDSPLTRSSTLSDLKFDKLRLEEGASEENTRGGFVTPFRELLERLNQIYGLDRIRFTSSNPHDMTRDILDAHFDLPKMCHFLHFALQSGDNELLKKMNRKHTYDDFKTMVDYLRSRDPLFGISTDVIVGFPGETDEQFENTMRAFRECQFDFAYIARYSPRKLTYAAKMPTQVPADVKAERWDRLNSLMYEIIQERNKLMIGREEVILVSKIDEEDGTISGRTRNFKEVFLPKNEMIKLGDLVPVKILELDRWVLRGEVI